MSSGAAFEFRLMASPIGPVQCVHACKHFDFGWSCLRKATLPVWFAFSATSQLLSEPNQQFPSTGQPETPGRRQGLHTIISVK